MKLDTQLKTIMEDVCQQYGLNSILLADQRGLALSYAGKVAHEGIAAIAPELIRVGEHAVRLGEYDSITCVALVLENSHLLIIKDIEVHGTMFLLVMDTMSVPSGLAGMIRSVQKRVEGAMENS